MRTCSAEHMTKRRAAMKWHFMLKPWEGGGGRLSEPHKVKWRSRALFAPPDPSPTLHPSYTSLRTCASLSSAEALKRGRGADFGTGMSPTRSSGGQEPCLHHLTLLPKSYTSRACLSLSSAEALGRGAVFRTPQGQVEVKSPVCTT
ncbi:hypothetical protein Bbelb_165910 [Branchiostoma belcheri]|nr:hypothetical protein Bbelb_165910 [Branchiostoma belcheri]